MNPVVIVFGVAVIVGVVVGILGSIALALVGLSSGELAFLIPFASGATSAATVGRLARPATC